MREATGANGAMPWARFALATVAVLAALPGCGSGGTPGASEASALGAAPIPGKTLTIYVSATLRGASRVSGAAVVDGAELALARSRDHVGGYRIALKVLDDATVQRGGWDPGQTTMNARVAVLDPTTIGYVGDANSGASAISIPPLNRAGIPQVSPTSTAVGLTSGGPGAFPGEPQKYYPTGVRTFARVVPDDSVQAMAQVRVQQTMGCRTTYVLQDGEVDGADAARSFEVAAQAARIELVGVEAFPRNATNYKPLALGVAHTHPDCVLISADTESGAVPLTEQLAAAMPDVKLFGSAGLAETTYADPGQGGLPLWVDPRVMITAPTLGAAEYPAAARVFAVAYQRRFGQVEPDSIFGYEAMSLLLNAVARATDGGTRPAVRSQVRAALFATRDRHSVLGTYSIDRNGDMTQRRYGVYTVVAGRLTFQQAMDTSSQPR